MGDRESSIVLVSGGINSAVVALHAATTSDARFLYVSHGHIAAQREEAAVRALGEALAAPVHVATVICPTDGGGAAGRRERHRDEANPTPEPSPNGLMLTMLGLAEQLATRAGATTIVCGTSQVCDETDRSAERGQGDPSARQLFLHAAATAMQFSLPAKRRLSFEFPLIQTSRADIVRIGIRQGAPFHLTWSCHLGGENPCDQCPGCVSRTVAFDAVGAVDPSLERTR